MLIKYIVFLKILYTSLKANVTTPHGVFNKPFAVGDLY